MTCRSEVTMSGPAPDDSTLTSPSGGRPDPAREFLGQWQGDTAPRWQDFLAGGNELPATQIVSVLRVDQRQRWQRGDRVSVEEYLESRPGLRDDGEAVLDLIYNEVVLREEAGERPTL